MSCNQLIPCVAARWGVLSSPVSSNTWLAFCSHPTPPRNPCTLLKSNSRRCVSPAGHAASASLVPNIPGQMQRPPTVARQSAISHPMRNANRIWRSANDISCFIFPLVGSPRAVGGRVGNLSKASLGLVIHCDFSSCNPGKYGAAFLCIHVVELSFNTYSPSLSRLVMWKSPSTIFINGHGAVWR